MELSGGLITPLVRKSLEHSVAESMQSISEIFLDESGEDILSVINENAIFLEYFALDFFLGKEYDGPDKKLILDDMARLILDFYYINVLSDIEKCREAKKAFFIGELSQKEARRYFEENLKKDLVPYFTPLKHNLFSSRQDI